MGRMLVPLYKFDQDKDLFFLPVVIVWKAIQAYAKFSFFLLI